MSAESFSQAPLQAGSLLVAAPQMLDPNFMHSVILLCSVESEGAMGFVINAATEFRAGELLGDRQELEESEQEVFTGGPVGGDQMHFLHGIPERIEGGIPILDGVWLGGEFDDLAGCLNQEKAGCEALRLFVGYSGWGAGQLESELALNSWLIVPGKSEHLFEWGDRSREEFWREVLGSQGPGGRILSQMPPDPEWN